MNAAATADRSALDAWWRTFVATGAPGHDLQLVQGRLVRAVYRGQLPSGPVHVKVMTFPRAKDRLRYAVRALPAQHEARLLRAVAQAGVPCPEVLDVRTLRRGGLPFRSMLVLRTLALANGGEALGEPWQRLAEEATLGLRLLRAGIEHRDLHSGNFVRLAEGPLAVLDLQSASLRAPREPGRRQRLLVAARLLRDRPEFDLTSAVRVLGETGLLRDASDATELQQRLAADRAHYQRTRLHRCLTESTEFAVQWRWNGREFRRREAKAPAPGRWVAGGGDFAAAWLGQRALHLATGRTPLFVAMFRKWWWLGGGVTLYVPATCSDEHIEPEVRAAAAGIASSAPPQA